MLANNPCDLVMNCHRATTTERRSQSIGSKSDHSRSQQSMSDRAQSSQSFPDRNNTPQSISDNTHLSMPERKMSYQSMPERTPSRHSIPERPHSHTTVVNGAVNHYQEVEEIEEVDSEGEEGEGSGDEGWEEQPGDQGTVLCLFCNHESKSAEDTFEHCKVEHRFDIMDWKLKLHLDCFSYIKLINFIRKEKPSSIDCESIDKIRSVAFSKGEEFLQPTIPDDPLLMFDIESSGDDSQDVIINDPAPPWFDTTCDMLKDTMEKLESTRAVLLQLLDGPTPSCVSRAESMYSNQAGTSCCDVRSQLNDEDEDDELAAVGGGGDTLGGRSSRSSRGAAAAADKEENDGYFGTYSHFGIHQEMLQDYVRMEAYYDAILGNSELFAGRTVLDVGCGTGILSMFSAQAGAAKVIAVDESDIIYHAMDIVRENKLENRISLIKGRIEDVVLPSEKVDIIVSEWMGYMLLFEAMLESVVMARQCHLATGGRILPDRCVLSIVGVSDMDRYNRNVSFWDDVYGFRMTCMKHEVVHEASVETVGVDNLLTTPCDIKEFDLYTCTSDEMEFTAPFALIALYPGHLTALACYFDCYFNLPHKVCLSTSPLCLPTHWKQTVFYLPKPLLVDQGQPLEGKVTIKRNVRDKRSLKIMISLKDQNYNYILQ